MTLPLLVLLALPLCLLSCSSSKPASSAAYSNALAPRDVKTVDKSAAPFVASKTGKVYHTRYCRYAASLTNVIGFATARDAEAKGLIPCEFCNPQSNTASVAPGTGK